MEKETFTEKDVVFTNDVVFEKNVEIQKDCIVHGNLTIIGELTTLDYSPLVLTTPQFKKLSFWERIIYLFNPKKYQSEKFEEIIRKHIEAKNQELIDGKR